MSAPGAKGSMYGVNTGVGASGAVTRTSDRTALQRVILKNLTSGILPLETPNDENYLSSHHESTLLLPESWSRGAMLLRLNTLLRGHSGCRWIVIEKLHALLVNNIIPSPPLRQSISASGDLAPLGYIASALTDEVVVPVWSGKGSDRKRTTSIEARKAHGIDSIIYGPKEALAIVNGTGPSCAVGALALHDANILALTAQLTTAMAIEALNGSPETYDAFIHDVARPHPGQIEFAANGRHLLQGSKLAQLHDESDPTQKLRQDRYGLRTAPQWLGPHLEELITARATLEIEMNSTTDNPIIDLENERSLGGGNFQGTSVALVMEKMRIGLQHIGKLVHAQFIELASPHMNRGLPPDLGAWEPSLDFGVKTMDVATAAYLSELSYLGNTVTNHVQNAEHHNQAVNSLALISARYTFHAIQVLYLLFSNHIWALCQALDLRAMIRIFFDRMQGEIKASLANGGFSTSTHAALTKLVYDQVRVKFNETSHMDSSNRFTEVLRPIVADVLEFLSEEGSSHTFNALEWKSSLAPKLGEMYREVRAEYYANGSAEALMGNTVHLYRFVRHELGIPMRKGGDLDTEGVDAQLSRLYRAFERGGIVEPVLACFKA
ncbi:phenylalanine ammonia-lyase [Dendrothele bispora CBS 962.96]|uniref:Phenylalanine ammonia-lyase n=1 Tax=Dendrothele bispora (strain CBS 962.96) TaxID=1314807 RepID=A0A4S8MDH9_DENBC|nr:phenylalanine ammonia-lyase [Dendrothele bispora CBS 962.96]